MVRLALTIAAGLAIALLLDDLTAFPGPLPGFERIGQDMIGDWWSFEFRNNVAPNLAFRFFQVIRRWWCFGRG